jgi:phosphatidylglycerophosphate synthase
MNANVAALILVDHSRFLGMDLTERAATIARGAGIERLYFSDGSALIGEYANRADTLVVFDARTIIEPKGVREALARAGTGVLDLTSEGATQGRFSRRIDSRFDIPRVERAYLSHTSGGSGEGPFTRQVRRFSIPISRFLLRHHVKANHVTLAGFALAIAAGISFAVGGYWAGVVGALLYFFSTILDCSDGEVARGSFGESHYGAWLETVTDYLSYFVVLGGIVWGDLRVEGFCIHAKAAIVAAIASLAIVSLVGYLRIRVASENPGALDDALAAELRTGTLVQRFTGWSRQLIKRSFFSHLVVFQAVIGYLPALTEIWACGSVAGVILILAVQTHLIRRVRVSPSHALAQEN